MIRPQAWSQFPTLADLFVKVYTAPGSTAGVERQHKVAKRVHTAVRNRTGGGKVHEQVAVAHNSVVAKLQLDDKRQQFEKWIVSEYIGTVASEATAAAECDDTQGDLTEAELMEQDVLNAALGAMSAPWAF
ncbi:hypothetical protein PC129_g10805 [Phytophthora cactorum]|uniref:HAT C-terminal dimerisation domain-containing protein n=1 Tax=Phytophthora cactorum TaxID=29920 RepID=A0A8T0YYQ6_9STRA|nr:hypothetical protein Pcac1_g4477 [Phytophthora cactorum]KAG2819133.1 hypothetical protein PC112_g12312 [Phytophthora cactorum]KAG2820997.1 hypothetical protein PC111_g11215 [Phytophthora cactorum]KAG2854940.1 hypothetical protein PC113_g12873 [Phytophthora cactorum]KAG2900659.1 hypothetical protein PC114_g13475 [Phytophthora cactorum]